MLGEKNQKWCTQSGEIHSNLKLMADANYPTTSISSSLPFTYNQPALPTTYPPYNFATSSNLVCHPKMNRNCDVVSSIQIEPSNDSSGYVFVVNYDFTVEREDRKPLYEYLTEFSEFQVSFPKTHIFTHITETTCSATAVSRPNTYENFLTDAWSSTAPSMITKLQCRFSNGDYTDLLGDTRLFIRMTDGTTRTVPDQNQFSVDFLLRKQITDNDQEASLISYGNTYSTIQWNEIMNQRDRDGLQPVQSEDYRTFSLTQIVLGTVTLSGYPDKDYIHYLLDYNLLANPGKRQLTIDLAITGLNPNNDVIENCRLDGTKMRIGVRHGSFDTSANDSVLTLELDTIGRSRPWEEVRIGCDYYRYVDERSYTTRPSFIAATQTPRTIQEKINGNINPNSLEFPRFIPSWYSFWAFSILIFGHFLS